MKYKKDRKHLLKDKVRHVDIKEIDSTKIIDAMRDMSFTSRDTATATDYLNEMIKDKESINMLTIAGSTSAGGCMDIYIDMVKSNMVDVVVATGATIVDMDFFEALGFHHYKGSPEIDDGVLRERYIDRIYDTLIDEVELQKCDEAIQKIANSLEHRPYSSREFIHEMGRYLEKHGKKHNSLIEVCFEKNVPIFVPAFSDCSAGFGLVMHQVKNPDSHLTIDSVRDFRELTKIKMSRDTSGLFIIGGGAPKNFAQDTVVCAELLGEKAPMHKYAVQITVADVRDGACSSSTLQEAHSWGKVDRMYEKMVFAEATTVLPLMISYVYHKGDWKKRKPKELNKLFDK